MLKGAEGVFGRRMRQERERRGWTQQRLAFEMGLQGVDLHPSAIAKMEASTPVHPRAIRLNEAAAAAAALGLTLGEMTGSREDAVSSAERWLQQAVFDAFQVERRVTLAISALSHQPGFQELMDSRPDLAQWAKEFESPQLQDNVQNLIQPMIQAVEATRDEHP